MDWQIRLMRYEDLSAITNVECTALHISKEKSRNTSFLEIALINNPNGCLVGVSGGCIVGYIITMITGNVGWIGSIEVSLSQGGNGMKLALLNEAIKLLSKKAAVTAIQLPNESIRFIQKCIELGFQLVEPQIVLSKKTKLLSSFKEKNVVSILELEETFGVTNIITLMAEKKLGKIITLETEKTPAGKLLLETQPRRLNSSTGYSLITFGNVIRNLTAQPLKTILTIAGKEAMKLNSETLYIALNGFYRNELQILIECGWKVVKISQRLIYKKSVSSYKQTLAKPFIDISQWTL
ncbi:MAG: hypothetical protein DRI44_09855 [Chlamydiae bacterium]|nr:MAG: hypothetical protein DRI44_09855 [Chlamydiota bacterium]